MSSMWPASSNDSWFRVGRLEVTTVMFVVLVTVASWLAWVIYPPLSSDFALIPGAVSDGQVWRLITWPLADGLSFWGVLNLFFFWYFGTELEGQIGRRRMAWFLGGVWLSLTTATMIVGFVSPALFLAGIGPIEFMVLLVWIAEYPRRPLFFGIQAWVFGAILLALQVLQLLAARGWANIVSLLLGVLLVAIVARSQGLLSDYAWIPGRTTKAARPARPKSADRAAARQQTRRASDRERLDTLLDRISEGGLQSLTDAERKELGDIRNRLRGDR